MELPTTLHVCTVSAEEAEQLRSKSLRHCETYGVYFATHLASDGRTAVQVKAERATQAGIGKGYLLALLEVMG